MQHKGGRGFTLIEMMAVVVIIGILAAIIAVNVTSRIPIAEVAAARQDLRTLEQAIQLFRMDTRTYPVDLVELVEPPDGTDSWLGPYLRAMPRDPWGNEYQYQCPGSDDRAFDLRSWGADGKPGGEGDNTDLML